MIVKVLGCGGTEDPLDQRSTVGWKASHTAMILYDERMVRVESGSSYSDIDIEN
jgi:N4-gp56 family major capsid protein